MSAALQNLNFIISLTDRMSKPLGGIMKTIDGIQAKVGKGALNIGIGTAGLYAVGTAFDKITDKSIQFETAMADLNRVKNFANIGEMKAFGEELLTLTHTIPMTGMELAKISEQGAALQLNNKDLIDFTKQVAYNTVAWGLSAEETGGYMAAFSKTMDIPIQKIGEFGDTVNFLTNKTGTAPAQVLDTINRIASLAKGVKFTNEQIAALSNTFVELKVEPDKAGTAINNMMIKLGAARTESKAFQEALGSVGLTVDQLEANLKSAGGQATFNDFLARLAKLDETTQRNVGAELFGKEHAGKLTLLVQKLDIYQKNLGLAGDKQSQLNSSMLEFQTRADTTAGRISQLNNIFDHLQIATGDVFTGIFSEAFPGMHDWLQTLIGDIKGFTGQHPLLTKAIAYSVIGLGALVAILSVGAIAWGLFTLAMIPALLPFILIAATVGALAWAINAGSAAVTDFLVAADPVGYLTAKWEGLKTWWYGLPVALSIAAVGFMQQLGVFAAIDWVLAKWEALKAWWSNFTGWLSGLNPFGSLLGGIDSVINRVAGIGAAMRSALSGGNVSIPAVSVAPGGGGAPRNILGALQGKGGSNSTSNKNVTVNVHNNGGSVSPAAIGHHLKMAGG